MANVSLIPEVWGRGKRCDACDPDICNEALEVAIICQQAYNFAEQRGEPQSDASKARDREHVKAYFKRAGCLFKNDQVEELIATICGDEELRSKANEVMDRPIFFITKSQDQQE